MPTPFAKLPVPPAVFKNIAALLPIASAPTAIALNYRNKIVRNNLNCFFHPCNLIISACAQPHLKITPRLYTGGLESAILRLYDIVPDWMYDYVYDLAVCYFKNIPTCSKANEFEQPTLFQPVFKPAEIIANSIRDCTI